mgnify:CR=1 FL=1
MKNLISKLLICCAFVSFSLHAMAETPDELVRDTSRQVLDVLKRDNGKNTKNIRAEVEALVLPKFDFTRMTALAVGRGWRDATPDQQKQLTDQFRNDQAYQAQFGQALAYDVNQRHEEAVFRSQSVQDDQGLQRQASEVLGAQQEYRRMAAANQGVGQQVSISEPDLVGMLRSNQKASDFVQRAVFEHGLQGEARDNEWLTKDLYPGDPVGRILAADARALLTSPSISATQRAEFSAKLGDLLGLSPVRELGDAEQHAGIGPGMDSMGTIEGKVARKDVLGADIQAGTTAKLDRSEQEVDAGQNKVAQRSAENNASVQHHQDINKVDAQLQREAADEAATDLGRDKNLGSLAHDGHEGLKDGIKAIPDLVVDTISPPPPSVTEQIGLPPT